MFYNDSIFRILFLEKIEFGDFEQFSSNFNSKKIANFLQKTSYFLCYLVGVIYKGRTRNWDVINQMKRFKCQETEDENSKDALVVAERVFGGGVLAMWVVQCRCFSSGAQRVSWIWQTGRICRGVLSVWVQCRCFSSGVGMSRGCLGYVRGSIWRSLLVRWVLVM